MIHGISFGYILLEFSILLKKVESDDLVKTVPVTHFSLHVNFNRNQHFAWDKTDYTMDKIIGAALVYFLGKLNLTSILVIVQ